MLSLSWFPLWNLLLVFWWSTTTTTTHAFHDCIEAAATARRRRRRQNHGLRTNSDDVRHTSPSSFQKESSCSGGLCVGMTHGPHQGGNASYPVAWNGQSATKVEATMTVPELPKQMDGITYYLWTDIFFGDASLGRMNQLVPQLLLGNVLDSSSGIPDYQPYWHKHYSWSFGAHYFFEVENSEDETIESHAAYGDLHPTWPGESLYTTFELSSPGEENEHSPKWTLTMGVVGDDTRVSTLVVARPYMGLGVDWDEPTVSWTEPAYRNMCLNACWELYGATDADHLPSSGARYALSIEQPEPASYPFTTWEQDERNGACPSCKVIESHGDQTQKVQIYIEVQPAAAVDRENS